MFAELRRKRAIRSYAKVLPRRLARDYGAAPSYSPLQITRTLERSGLPMRHLNAAIVMFGSKADFDLLEARGAEDYDILRLEILNTYFGGHDNWSFLEAGGSSGDASGSHATSGSDAHGHAHGSS